MSSDSEIWSLIGVPLLIFLARIADVSLGTLRIALISRGQKSVAPLIGFVEILIWLIALGQVVQHLERPLNYIAYAGGFAAGTWVGLLLDEKLALGLLAVRVITRQDATGIIERLKRGQFGVTSVAARGLTGRVRLIFSIVRRRDLPRVLEVIRGENPHAFVSVSDVRLVSEGYISPLTNSKAHRLETARKK